MFYSIFVLFGLAVLFIIIKKVFKWYLLLQFIKITEWVEKSIALLKLKAGYYVEVGILDEGVIDGLENVAVFLELLFNIFIYLGDSDVVFS